MSNTQKKIFIIDDDDTAIAFVKGHLEKSGDYEVESSMQANRAWQEIQKSPPDIIILDWKMPECGGLAIINRLKKSEDLHDLPVIITSGYLENQDFTLLESMPLSARLKKPPNPILLIRKVEDLLKQSSWLKSTQDNFFDAKSSMAEIVKTIEGSPLSVPLAIGIGRRLRHHHSYEEAEKFIQIALDTHPDNVLALGEMGKLMLVKGDLDKAEDFLKKAQALSPKSTENLCTLGEINMQRLETTEAKKKFDEALAIDPYDQEALSGNILSENISDYLGSDISDIPNNFASLLNAVGVFNVKKNQIEKGIEHYESSLSYVISDENKSRVAYNVALGYTKNNDLENASSWIQKSLEYWPDNPKSQEFSNKVNELKKSKAPVNDDISYEDLVQTEKTKKTS